MEKDMLPLPKQWMNSRATEDNGLTKNKSIKVIVLDVGAYNNKDKNKYK
jgi:hypothetical protein